MSMSKQLLQCDSCPYQKITTRKHQHMYKRLFFVHFMQHHEHITDAEKLVCDQCGHAMFVRAFLWRHIFYKHLGQLDVEMLVCDRCERRFTTAYGLHKHFLVRHTAEKKQFLCADCGYSTNGKHKLLVTHIAIQHLGIRLNKCNVCFKEVSTLKRHQLAKHEDVKYECDVCGKRLSIKSNLVNHLHLHMLQV